MVRAADQVELVDMTAEALRRRMAHGNIYPPEKVDAALANYFRVGNLTALRELALLWLADKVDEGLQRYRAEHDIAATWETRERVVVALTGGPEGDTLIRRAARIAARSPAATCSRSTSPSPTGSPARTRPTWPGNGSSSSRSAAPTTRSSATTSPRRCSSSPEAENATQLVLGASRRGMAARPADRAPASGADHPRLRRHRRPHRHARARRRPVGPPAPVPGGITRRRQVAGLLLAVVLVPLLTLALTTNRSDINLTSDVLVFLVAVVAVALVGGFLPALLAAIAGSLLLNYYFTPPIHQFTIAETNNVLALGVFVAVGLAVSWVVDTHRAADQASGPRQRRVRAARDHGGLHPARPGRARRAARADQGGFGMRSACLLERKDAGAGAGRGSSAADWSLVACSGEAPVSRPDAAEVDVPVTDTLSLVLTRPPAPRRDRRVLGAFAAYAAVALDQQRLAAEAEAAKPIAAADRMRTALLAAVSHDLRTPLASAKAAVTSLRSPDMHWNAADTAELLATADESLDRLTRLVGEPARHEPGCRPARCRCSRARPALDEVVARGPRRPGPGRARHHRGRSRTTLPAVRADPAILERVVANLTENALRYSPAGKAAADRRDRARRPGRAAGHRPRPRHPRRPTRNACSSRSSDWATPTTRPASGSGSRCRAG